MSKKNLSDFTYDPRLHYPFYKSAKGGQRALLFIHIPKTGGTSIHRALNFPSPQRKLGLRKHNLIQDIAEHMPIEIWQSAFKFAFVRNPYDRLVSHYLYRKREGRILRHYGKELNFPDWVRLAFSTKGAENLRPQYKWISNAEGGQSVDFVGRFENLAQDFDELIKLVGLSEIELPHLNRMTKSKPYQAFYDLPTQQFVFDFYQEDFLRFDYSPNLY